MSLPIDEAGPATGPTGFRWRLGGPPGPPMPVALLAAEAARALVFRQAGRHGLMPLPEAFHGGTGAAHAHAHWLIEDEDRDGLADHALLFAASGLPAALLPVLAEGGELALRLADGARLPAPPHCWQMEPVWMGCGVPAYLFAAARQWRTITPFVTPLWMRRRSGARVGRDAASQLHRELALRGLPRPEQVSIEPGGADTARWIGSNGIARSRSGRRPPADAEAAHVALRFATPVAGPLALGFGAHFGLGLFGACGDGSETVARRP